VKRTILCSLVLLLALPAVAATKAYPISNTPPTLILFSSAHAGTSDIVYTGGAISRSKLTFQVLTGTTTGKILVEVSKATSAGVCSYAGTWQQVGPVLTMATAGTGETQLNGAATETDMLYLEPFQCMRVRFTVDFSGGATPGVSVHYFGLP
jgi:hypothetical protein